MSSSSPKYISRNIPRISLHSPSTRLQAITTALLSAASTSGFFILTNHAITPLEINSMFALSHDFFSLPDTTKSRVAFDPMRNAGWEKNAQFRPSAGGVPDRKESYQLQFGDGMTGKWIEEGEVPGFRENALKFMHKCQEVSELLMRCFAIGLGFEDEEFFIKAHDVQRKESQTVLRLLRYFAVPEEEVQATGKRDYVRAGAHVDWDFVTLLFQRSPQESGLEICPGREASTEFGIGDEWTKVEFEEGDIVCNIGDLLMRWSDDRLKSTFHRVRTPNEKGDWWGERYSIAYFNQPCTDCVIKGREGKYEEITGSQFTEQAMKRNFKALREKQEALKEIVGNSEEAVSIV